MVFQQLLYFVYGAGGFSDEAIQQNTVIINRKLNDIIHSNIILLSTNNS